MYPICQRYKFKSKSQRPVAQTIRSAWCIRYVKGTNLKANHNTQQSGESAASVYPICQRYKFKSKSQPAAPEGRTPSRCIRYVKGTNLKANHNIALRTAGAALVYPICQRYKFKSKSQHFSPTVPKVLGCIRYVKGTNLKANHNYSIPYRNSTPGVSDMSKVQI